MADLKDMMEKLSDENKARAERYMKKLLTLQRAERRLNGETETAINRVEKIDVQLAKDLRGKGLRCSFCGKHQDDIKRMIAGPGAYICNECVALSQEIIEEKE